MAEKRLHREPLSGLRRLVAERLANRFASLVAAPQHLLLARGPVARRRRSRSPVTACVALTETPYPLPCAVDRARRGPRPAPASPPAPAPPRSSSFSGGRTPRLRPIRVRSYALMKPAPSSASLQHRLQRAVERRIAGAVLEIGDQHRHRIVRARWTAVTASSHQVPNTRPSTADRHGQRPAPRERAGLSAAACRSHRGVEVRQQIGHRLISVRRLRLQAARDESIDRFRNRGSSSLTGGGACSMRSFSSSARRSDPPWPSLPSSMSRRSGRRVDVRRADRPVRPWPARAPCTATVPTMAPVQRGARGERAPGHRLLRDERRGRRPIRLDDRPRDAEVHDQACLADDHDVRGLQIAVHDAGFVRRHETGASADG